MTIAGEAANGVEAIEQAKQAQPDIVLLDLMMPKMGGVEATPQIIAACPQARVIILTSFGEDDQVIPAIRAGAQGYLLKDIPPHDLVQAVREAYQGKAQLHPDVAKKLMSAVAAPPAAPPSPEPDLTERELEVLRLIAQGLNNQQIAQKLTISEKTVKTHVSNILGKLHVDDRTQAAIYALKKGLGPVATARFAPCRDDTGIGMPVLRLFIMAVYLILASVIIRALVMFGGQPRLLVLTLLVVYGVLLVAYQQRRAWFAADRRRAVLYLGVQSLLVIGLILIPPHFDYFPLLFIPLSLSRRRTAGPALRLHVDHGLRAGDAVAVRDRGACLRADQRRRSWSTGLAMTILFGGAVLPGRADRLHVRQQAETGQQHNQRLLADLQVAHRQLQDHAAQLEELAVVHERSRLARELHDSVTQTVFSMTLAVQTAQVLLGKDVSRVAAQLDRVVELARNASREIQAIVKQLRPASIAEQGLAAALRDYLAERQARDGLIAHLEVKGEAHWPENVTLGLYRIVQEAVNNVIKHAGTREVTIKLNLCDQPASVEVIDHGAGFVVNETGAAARPHGIGEHGRARARVGLDADDRFAARPGDVREGERAMSAMTQRTQSQRIISHHQLHVVRHRRACAR